MIFGSWREHCQPQLEKKIIKTICVFIHGIMCFLFFKIVNIIIFYDVFRHHYCYFTSSPLFLYLPPTFLKSPHFPISLIRSFVPCCSPFYCTQSPIPHKWFLFTFLVSVVAPGRVLTSEDLELKSPYKRDHLKFVSLRLPHSV